MALAGVLNLLALAFTVAFSGFLLLGVNWPELLTAECIEKVGLGMRQMRITCCWE